MRMRVKRKQIQWHAEKFTKLTFDTELNYIINSCSLYSIDLLCELKASFKVRVIKNYKFECNN